MSTTDLTCSNEGRREEVRKTTLFGLDYVEVSDDQLTLEVFFLGRAPQKIERANVRITGGRSITDIVVGGVSLTHQKDRTLDDFLEIDLLNVGDYSTYTLSLVKLDKDGRPTEELMDGFDPLYATVEFSFKASCPSDQDCKQEAICPPVARETPDINYLAKDYASFRQLMLDRLALTLPGWQETHIPDIGITLVELLAYVGDHLSYHQDAVATEAYLGTARQRISVRRHARLVDYTMHEGCNARAWVTIATDRDGKLDPVQTYFCTSVPGAPSRVLQPTDVAKAPPGSFETFAPLVADPSQPIDIYQAHREIAFYTWGKTACCLTAGSTKATLADRWMPPPGNGDQTPSEKNADTATPAKKAAKTGEPADVTRALHLKVGDVLIFEEVIGPKTGNPADADPTHRQAVRLTKVTPAIDPLYHPYSADFGQPVVEIEWCSEDALTFPLCISASMPSPDCSLLANISVARGNVVLVDNSSPVSEDLGMVGTLQSRENCPTDCEPREVVKTPAKFRPQLSNQPLTFSQPMPACGCASQALAQDPRLALPRISLTSASLFVTQGTSHGSTEIPSALIDGLTDTSQIQPGMSVTGSGISEPNTVVHSVDSATAITISPASKNSVTTNLTFSGPESQWTAKADLLESGSGDCDFVVEIDDEGVARLRFGNGREGRMPDGGTTFKAMYSLGNGAAGNVGAETIVCVAFRQTTDNPGNLAPRNPLAAVGGTAPEPVADVKLYAPEAFRDTIERAVTADDYAGLAEDNARRLRERPMLVSAAMAAIAPNSGVLPGPSADDERATDEEEEGEDTPSLPSDLCLIPFETLQNARGDLRWTGSWYEAQVAVDPLGREDADGELLTEIDAYIEPYRRIGHDLNVRQARYVPLDVGLLVCVGPQVLSGHVETALLDVFSNRVLPGGKLGFFHPDRFTFGTAVFASRIIATAQAVAGVTEVQLLRLARYEPGSPPPARKAPDTPLVSELALKRFEIACLDNDPSLPTRGRLTLYMRGGR